MDLTFTKHSNAKEHSIDGALMVAVYLITYNHENYIAQAIESIITQQTNFKYKLFIGEDSSTDNTGKICKEYAIKYPDKISLRINRPNKLIVNSKSTYDACFESGAKYVAMLEGDDYWTDTAKLQKQVDFLEAHSDYTFCGHVALVFDQTQQKITDKFEWKKDTITLKDAVFSPAIHTSSQVYRNGFGLPKNFFKINAGDDALICYLAERGNGHYFRESMSVYRHSNIGTWSTLNVKEKEYRALLIQTWILKNYRVRVLEQTQLIYTLYNSVKKFKTIFSVNYTTTQKTVIICSIIYYKSSLLNLKIKKIMSQIYSKIK